MVPRRPPAAQPGTAAHVVTLLRGLASSLLLAVVVLSPTADAGAQGELTIQVATATVPEVADWSFGAPGGRWDFEGPTDGWPLSPSEDPPSTFSAWARPVDGSIVMPGRRTVHLLYAQSGAVPSLTNGHLAIDGTRWDLFSTYVFVDAPAFLFVQARQCDMRDPSTPRPDCVASNVSIGKPLAAGWNLVADLPVTGPGWDDAVEGFQVRICPRDGVICSTDPAAPLHSELAWVRLSDAPAPAAALTVEGGIATRVGWRRVPDTGRSADRGEVDVEDGVAPQVPLGLLEPGDYELRASDGATWGPWSAPVRVAGRPRPVVVDPDALGEEQDWSAAVRADPWDFEQDGDAERVDGVGYWFRLDGWLRGLSTWSDPRVTLDVGGRTINTRRWHRLSVEVDNPGPWHLTGTSGVLGRLLWWPSGAAAGDPPVTGDDVIVPGGSGWVHVDLATDPSVRVEEMGGQGVGWSELGAVRALRWDPHEVDDQRPFGIGAVRLARNDRVDALDRFTIRWRDDAWRPGTAAEVALVEAPGALGGTVIGTVAMDGPEGALAWTNPGTQRGTWWVRVTLTGPDGASSDAWSTGPLDVTERATFTDVAAGSTFHDDIDWLVGERLASGVPDTYRPSASTTRQAMTAFLYRLAGAPDGTSPTCEAAPFSDVPVDHVFCGEIAWAAAAGIAHGRRDGTFGPEAPVTRGAMVSLLHGYAEHRGHAGAEPGCQQDPFADVPASHVFCAHIAWAAGADVARGYADGTFRASAPITRAGMAAFVRRAHELIDG